jgi:hypothetical protein
MDKELRNRVGKFKMDLDAITQWDNELAFKIMSLCIVVRAEHNFYDRYIEYVALSYEFDVVEPGMEPPTYMWEYNSETDVIRAIHEPTLMENTQTQLEKAKESLSEVAEYINWYDRTVEKDEPLAVRTINNIREVLKKDK